MSLKHSSARHHSPVRLCLLLSICAIALALSTIGGLAQKSRKISGPSRKISGGSNRPNNGKTKPQPLATKTSSGANMQDPFTGITVGSPQVGEKGLARTNAEIMEAQVNAPPSNRPLKHEREVPGREIRPQDPDALPVSRTPNDGTDGTKPEGAIDPNVGNPITPYAPQTVSTNFNAVTGPAETSAFPPDTMGAVGPTQFVLFVNGRLRTFNKTTGAADGVVNVDPDVFFASVMTPNAPPLNINFTSDPQIRYDRLTARWIMIIIDVPSATTIGDRPNRILVAVSDAASAGVISAGTVWTFYFVQQDTVGPVASTGEFLDYPSLGVDTNALYIGGDMFGAASGSFVTTSAFVIRKTSILSGGPIVTTAFRTLISGAGPDGPLEPRGVDNYDPASTEGYFIGPSYAAFGRLILRRIATPGATPTISANINITVSATSFPITVDHLGDTGGTNGNIDALDDRLFAAHIRGGRLWTAHNLAVTPLGVASNSNAQRRDAVRWYELIIPPGAGAPTVNQSGTIFDPAGTVALSRQYLIPSVTVSGQGHAAIGFTTAGTPFRIDAATNGRLVGDALGTTQAVNIYTTSSTAYNPPGDPGPPRRWGDYSFTSLDPKDDMTMWTVQEYCSAANSYGARVAKLLAPPPATPASATGNTIAQGVPSSNVVVTGTVVAGSGFYDPGTNLAPPALPFTHISATVPGGVTVNSVTYTSPTQVTLNVSTVGASLGAKTITITNPDGQSLSGTAVINVVPPTATAGQVIISEFRLRGTGGADDEYVELYNATNNALDISGFTLHSLTAAGAQVLRFTLPGALGSGTTQIPARGHYLMTGSAYSLAAAAASDGALAAGTVDGSDLGLFGGATPTAPTRIDSAGFDTRDALFFEGTAITPSGAGTGGITVNGEYAFLRKLTAGGFPQDTGNNNNDFTFVSVTGGTFSTRVSTLGAPGPENLAGPIHNATGSMPVINMDPPTPVGSGANFLRNFTAVANGPAGTVTIRRTFTNSTGAPLTRLRFRLIDLSNLNSSPTGPADLRVLSSTLAVVGIVGPNASCPANSCSVQGTTVETPPTQAIGGGLDSTVSAGTVTAGTPLANGATINLSFMFGVVTPGNYRFALAAEGLPSGLSRVVSMSGCVDTSPSTVTCSAPTASAASISGRITTSDGNPLSGVTMRLAGSQLINTITDSNGKYHFDNVETNNFYTVTPALPNYRFSPSNRSFSLLGNNTDSGFTAAADTVVAANAIDTSEYFVRQQYLDFLGREPDQGGFEYWSNEINNCGGDAGCINARRIDVAAAFFVEREFQDTGSFIHNLYSGTLGRAPSFAEFMPDRSRVVGGAGLEQAKASFASEFVNRPEFAAKYPTTLSREQFVDSLLVTAKSRSGAELSSLRASLLQSFDSGGRVAVVRQVIESSAFAQAEYNKAFVLMEYFGYLRRDPEPEGYDFWLNVLDQREPGNYRGMVCSFITSNEYQRRFSSYTNHSNAECGR
ncbi:MAG: hypothetical protein QOE77_2845 [Blastocatellia bacterium]|jgi:hypothetical protein|nr:hypothetical protein [Blastocatellia bacterium]